MLFSAIVVAIALLFIAGACLYPFLHSKILQWRMVNGLIKDSGAMGYKHRRFYKNIFFVKNLSYKYDIVIYDEKRLYALKLWTAYHGSSSLVLTEDGRIYSRRTVSSVMDIIQENENKNHVKGICRNVPKTRLPKKFLKGREIVEIILIYPAYKEIVYEGRGQKIRLNEKDELFDKTIYSPTTFISELSRGASVKSNTENQKEDVGSVSENI